MLVNEPSLAYLQWLHAQHGLPEPFIYGHREDGRIVGVIEGWIHGDFVAIEHLIVVPSAPHKFRTMMAMSREATRLLRERGLEIALKILKTDERTGLRAWALRCNYLPYAEDQEARWYRYTPPERNPDGKESAAVAEGRTAAARSE